MNPLLAAWTRTVRRDGGRRALLDPDGTTLRFADLAERAARWQAAHAAGVDLRGRAVVFALPNGAAWFEVFLGVLSAGAIAVPLDPSEPAGAQRAAAEEVRAGAWWDGGRLVALARPRRFGDPGVALVKLTSGSTGRPRPLVFTAAQMLADARQVTRTMGITRADLNYGLIPLGHSYGLGNLAIPLVAFGIPVALGTSPLPHAIAADFARCAPTVFPGVPAVWRGLAESSLDAAALRSLRLGISAGAPLPPEVARAFADRFGRRLHGFYGSSETGGIAFDRTGAATLAGGVGRALRGVKLHALSAQRLRVCSAAVTTFRRPRRGGLGCWIVPDRVTLGRGGAVNLLGRRGAMVKIAGRRVNLGEVAAALRRLPGVRDAWIGAQDGPEPVLGAGVASDRPVAELRSRLGASLAAWKVPRRWAAWPAGLPVNDRGKPDVAAIRAAVFR
ncbi:MAG TPA: class I adenylate-forming enzyme family protein [Opitutaceae bacterium]|nr:class I adenylate-forming enzyme family protein [Opitutaceae bacterium]